MYIYQAKQKYWKEGTHKFLGIILITAEQVWMEKLQTLFSLLEEAAIFFRKVFKKRDSHVIVAFKLTWNDEEMEERTK